MVIGEKRTGKFQGIRRHVVRMVRKRLPDDIDSLFPAVLHKCAAEDVTCRIGIATGHKPRHIAHAPCRFVKDAAGMRNPCAGILRLPCGEKIRTLGTCGITIEHQLVRTDIIFFLNLFQGFHKSGTRPRLWLPVVVVRESGRDQENFVFIRPFRPAELAGDFLPYPWYCVPRRAPERGRSACFSPDTRMESGTRK